MNQDTTQNKSGSSGPWLAIAAVAVFAAAAVAVWMFVSVKPEGVNIKGSRANQTEAARRLQLAQSAIAGTENLVPEEADQAWQELFGEIPGDASVALNRALNRTLRVDSLTGEVTNASVSDEDQKVARSKLPDAIMAARQAIADFKNVGDDEVMGMWLESRVALREASLLPASLTKSNRKSVLDKLIAAIDTPIGKQPKAVILAGPLTETLDNLEDPLDGLPVAIRDKAAFALAKLSDLHPQNIFIARYAARLNIPAKREVSSKLVQRTGDLASSIKPALTRLTQPIGLTPDELVAEIKQAVESGDWTEAESRMMLWSNVLNATEIVKTDRRRASPHPLDRLSFDCVRNLASEVAKANPVSTGKQRIVFDSVDVQVDAEVTSVLSLDYDLDLRDDLAAVTIDGKLLLIRNEDEAWRVDGAVDLPDGFDSQTKLFATDLFMVDSSDPQRIKAARGDTEGGEQDFSNASRHNSFPTLVAYGAGGVRLVSVDGRPDTAGGDRLSIVEGESGLESVGAVTSLISGDLEGDGDLDLIVATKDQGVRMFVNRGNRTFFEIPQGGIEVGEGAKTPVAAMAIADIDRDLDLDVVVLRAKTGRVDLIENLLHLQFRIAPLAEVPPIKDATLVQVAELDGNVSWDLVVAGPAGGNVVYSQTAGIGRWTVDRVVPLSVKAVSAIADFDNDSFYEAISATEAVRLGTGKLAEIESSLLAGVTSTSDFNGDGLSDVAGIAGGKPFVGINRTDNSAHHMTVRFRGIDDNNANSGRVNHFAIGSVLELRFGPHYRAKVITSPATHFGMNGADKADSIRVIMPNGLTQTIRNPTIDVVLEEEQTLKGSCPYLYAWDGTEIAFVTDCLWAAPLGLQVAKGVVAKDRPWEYLKVDGDFIRPRDGVYDLRLTEELWEVAYFDHVALQAVDHPADVDIWTNEKVGPGHLAQQAIFAFGPEDRRPLAAAQDTAGRDVTKTLAKIDQDFVQGFDRRLRQGLCPPHWIDMSFDLVESSQDDGQSRYLVLTGWILPTDTSLNIQIDQNPGLPPIEFPSLWVPDDQADGGWRKAIDYVGFPGGKTKTIVVDVTDIVDLDDPQFRLRTSAQIYWDSAYMAVVDDPAKVVTHDVELLSAEVGFRGFSAKHKPGPKQPETYAYDDVSTQPKWPPLSGLLTNAGPAIQLLRDWDDEMVVISGGDEIRLTFAVPDAPLPDGWKRDFVLHCVGWDKDADLNTLAGQTTGPLPFKSMSQYPPDPSQSDRIAETDAANRLHLGRSQRFREFWYRPALK